MSDVQKKITDMIEEMPAALPYGVREAIAMLKTFEKDLVRVREDVFVRDILPVLAGEEGDKVDMSWWAHRLESVYKGFYIVSIADEVLFEVPPLFDRNYKLVDAASARDTVTEARANFNNRAYNRPAQAREEYRQALSRRIDLTNGGRAREHMAMLDKILIHYGKPSIFEGAQSDEVRKLAATTSTAAQAPMAVSENEDMSYSDEELLD